MNMRQRRRAHYTRPISVPERINIAFLQKHFDTVFREIEKGRIITVVDADGKGFAMVPAKHEIIKSSGMLDHLHTVRGKLVPKPDFKRAVDAEVA